MNRDPKKVSEYGGDGRDRVVSASEELRETYRQAGMTGEDTAAKAVTRKQRAQESDEGLPLPPAG